MSLRLQANGNQAGTSDSSMLDCTGFSSTLKYGYDLGTMDGRNRRSCVQQLSAKPKQGWARVRTPVRYVTRLRKKLLISCEVKWLSQVALVCSTLVHLDNSLVQEVVRVSTTPVQFCRTMACHSWEQREWALCETWCRPIFSFKWAPRHTGGAARRKIHAEKPGSTACCERAELMLYIPSVLEKYCAGWPGYHEGWQGNCSISRLWKQKFCVLLLPSYRSALSLLIQVQKDYDRHGSKLVGTRNQLFATELPHENSLTLYICIIRFQHGSSILPFPSG